MDWVKLLLAPGPRASGLKSKPANLTILAKRNNGKCSPDAIVETVDGRSAIRHRGVEMPIWGCRQGPPPDPRKKARKPKPIDSVLDMPCGSEQEIQSRIRDIVEYLGSSSTPKGKTDRHSFGTSSTTSRSAPSAKCQAVIGQAYTAQFTASGGAGGNVFTLPAGPLPPGLSLSATGAAAICETVAKMRRSVGYRSQPSAPRVWQVCNHPTPSATWKLFHLSSAR